MPSTPRRSNCLRPYKGPSSAASKARARIVSGLVSFTRVPEAAADAGDDAIDAWIACHVASEFLHRRARWVGNPHEGGHVVPGRLADRVQFDSLVERARAQILQSTAGRRAATR